MKPFRVWAPYMHPRMAYVAIFLLLLALVRGCLDAGDRPPRPGPRSVTRWEDDHP